MWLSFILITTLLSEEETVLPDLCGGKPEVVEMGGVSAVPLKSCSSSPCSTESAACWHRWGSRLLKESEVRVHPAREAAAVGGRFTHRGA